MTHRIHAGDMFGHLTVLEEVHRGVKPSGQTYRRFSVRCDCSEKTEKVVSIGNLTSGHTTSCGCRQTLGCLIANTKHGKTGSRVYNIWQKMRARCEIPSNNRYQAYGGAGISVCAEWSGEDGFTRFLSDMGEPPEGHSIDRKDNTKGYNKENCRWATSTQQGRNKRNNILISHDNKTLPLSEWAEIRNIVYGTLHSRIQVYGWSVEEALEFKPRKQHENITNPSDLY